MKISIAITNHNQEKTVIQCIKKLKKQTILPYEIFVLSDAKPFKYDDSLVTCINNKKLKGRCDNRNSVIPEFLLSDSDALIYIDGDAYPSNKDFIENYIKLLNKYDLIFGTRKHTDISGLKLPPSDLLTANMDELWSNKKLNYSDLRIVSNAVKSFQESTEFNEKLDLMLTGMIGWSCNFGMTRYGIEKLIKFMYQTYRIDNAIFDNSTFSKGWGYEDVAMGIDALFAGLNIWIDESIEITHNSHERSDQLFDHVNGRHLIMERYRNITKYKNIKDKVYNLMIIIITFFFGGIITGLVTGFIAANN